MKVLDVAQIVHALIANAQDAIVINNNKKNSVFNFSLRCIVFIYQNK
jgi:hypothetical protein